MGMKKIIYTTDYSENSVAALKYAVSLAKLLQDDLIVLHVYKPSENNKITKKEHLKEQQEKLEAFCRSHLKEEYDDSLISVAAIGGHKVSTSILEFVRDMNVHMVVMGACGSSELKDRLLGSTTNEMIDIAHFPVLAVPSDFEYKKLEQVIFTSVFDEEDIYYLTELANLLKPLNARIKVVHVTHKDEEPALQNLENFKNLVQERVSYDKIEYQNIFSFKVFNTLREAIEEFAPDLVVMPERKDKNGVSRLIIKDRIKRMQSCTRVPLLSFPAPLTIHVE